MDKNPDVDYVCLWDDHKGLMPQVDRLNKKIDNTVKYIVDYVDNANNLSE
jgi:hypothetical protein